MKKAQVLSAILGLLVCLPIWFYLLYQVMVRVNASELMWFLFWIYVPASAIVQFIAKYLAAGEK
jgi:hypothetical protein